MDKYLKLQSGETEKVDVTDNDVGKMPDVEALKREVGDKYGRTDYPHNNGWRYAINWALDHLSSQYDFVRKI